VPSNRCGDRGNRFTLQSIRGVLTKPWALLGRTRSTAASTVELLKSCGSTLSCSHSNSWKLLAKVLGAEHTMMGTDYPFDIREYNPIGHVVESGLDNTTKTAIVVGNAAKLFRMGN